MEEFTVIGKLVQSLCFVFTFRRTILFTKRDTQLCISPPYPSLYGNKYLILFLGREKILVFDAFYKMSKVKITAARLHAHILFLRSGSSPPSPSATWKIGKLLYMLHREKKELEKGNVARHSGCVSQKVYRSIISGNSRQYLSCLYFWRA